MLLRVIAGLGQNTGQKLLNVNGKINLLPLAERVNPVLVFLVVLNGAVASVLFFLVMLVVLVRMSRTVRGWTQALFEWLD